MIKVDVGNQWNIDPFLDRRKGTRSSIVWHGDTNDLASRLLQPLDLRHGGIDIAGVGARHRLYDDRIISPNLDSTYIHHATHSSLLVASSVAIAAIARPITRPAMITVRNK